MTLPHIIFSSLSPEIILRWPVALIKRSVLYHLASPHTQLMINIINVWGHSRSTPVPKHRMTGVFLMVSTPEPYACSHLLLGIYSHRLPGNQKYRTLFIQFLLNPPIYHRCMASIVTPTVYSVPFTRTTLCLIIIIVGNWYFPFQCVSQTNWNHYRTKI